MDVNDIKVGDVVEMSYRSIYAIGEIYRGLQYDLESTNGVSLKSRDVEKVLNKYHVGDRVIYLKAHPFKGTITKVKGCGVSTIRTILYEVKMDNTPESFNAYEEDIIAMDEEKKVNFEVGNYVKIDSGKISPDNSFVNFCGHLGIIVAPGHNKDYWNVYFFALKQMRLVEERFLAKSEYEYEYEIKPKKKESHGLSSNSGRYPMEEFSASFIASRGNGKPLMSLKEMYKRYIENDDMAVKSALNFLYGAANFESDPLPKIKKVIFNGPATIVLWGDGDKTVVHCGEGDTMDKEKGLAMAICKKALGKSKTHYDYYNIFKKWIKEK